MNDVEAKINTIADTIAAEGMIVRAAGVRAAAVEIARLRAALARRGGLADYYNWRRPLLVRGRGVYSGWGLEVGLLRDE